MQPDGKTVVLKDLLKLCINWPMDFKYYSSPEERDLDGANRREDNETGERRNGLLQRDSNEEQESMGSLSSLSSLPLSHLLLSLFMLRFFVTFVAQLGSSFL